MSRLIKTESKVDIIEINGNEQPLIGSEKKSLKVREHWNRKGLVILDSGGTAITVRVEDLIRAVENAQNSHK